MKLLSQLLVFASALLFVSACSNFEGPPTTDLVTTSSDGGINCSVAVSSGQMTCDSPPATAARGLAFNITVGGPQNRYVTLASTGAAYNTGTHTFTVTVSLQNNSAQIMGTADGTTPHADGVQIFFFNQPAATGGTGTITVTGDGTGSFTHAGQPFYRYTGPIAPGNTPVSKLWSFDVPNTVTTFSFAVGVNSKVPDDAGVLKWASQAVGTAPLDGIAEACGNLWAVGGSAAVVAPPTPATGVIQFYNGTTWAAQTNPVPNQVLHAVDMQCNSGTATGVAVGENATILYYNGTNWASVGLGGTATLMSVSRAGTEWFACGLGGAIVHSANGTAWAAHNSSTTTDLFVCGGPSETNVYAGGANGFLTHYNGSWGPAGYSSGFAANTIRAATGSGSEIWLLGDNGTITHSTNGTAFTAQTSGTASHLYGAENFGAGVDLYAVGGNGRVLNYNGTSWTTQSSGLGTTDIINDLVIRTSGGGATFLDAWAVGNAGLVLHGTR